MRFFDVTRPLHDGLPAWPGDAPFQRRVQLSLAGERECRISDFTMSAHTGTHLDAPAHLGVPGELAVTVEQLDPALLVGPARVVDARGHLALGRELIHGLAGGPPRLLFRTDNSERPYRVDQFVAFQPEAAEALLGRAPLLVGIDGPSVDLLENGDLPVHRLLLDAGVVIIEGLELGRAAAGDYELICLPLPLVGADGAPARVLLRTTS